MVTTTAPCILVLQADVLIMRAFASLMMIGGEFEVAVSEALDVAELAADISKLKPHAVFISGSAPWSQKDSLAQLLIRHPGLKVIVVSNESNWLHIFRYEDRLLLQLNDLLQVIQSE